MDLRTRIVLITVRGSRRVEKIQIQIHPLNGWLRHVKRYGRQQFEGHFFFQYTFITPCS